MFKSKFDLFSTPNLSQLHLTTKNFHFHSKSKEKKNSISIVTAIILHSKEHMQLPEACKYRDFMLSMEILWKKHNRLIRQLNHVQ